MQLLSSLVRGFLLTTTLSACTYEIVRSDDDRPLPPAPPGHTGEAGQPGAPGSTTVLVNDGADAGDRPVTRDQELLITDPHIVADEAYTFSAMMERLAGSHVQTAAFTEAWLRVFAATRPGVEALLLGPWRTLSGCSAGYGTPSPCELNLEAAPFQLLAIVNRIDLAADACAPGGELRFVYTALDPATRVPLDATFIFEFPVRHVAGRVAAAWHALGRLPSGSGYAQELRVLTGQLLGATDLAAAHVRSDELSFAPTTDPVWELRDFVLQSAGERRVLVQNALVETPAPALDGTAALVEWVQSTTSFAALPTALQGQTARIPTATFGWTLPGVPETTRLAFSAGTCSGCHGGDRVVAGSRRAADRLPFQHVAPAAVPGNDGYGDGDGSTQVSTYLDARDGGKDELGRREEVLLQLAAADCSAPPTGPQYALPRRDH